MPQLEEILSYETRVWEALVTGDKASDEALLMPEFLGVYPEGFANAEDHSAQLNGGASVADYALSEARLLPVGGDHVMLSYLAEFRRVGRSEAEAMYVSSLWQRQGDGWRNLFSQDTPVGPGVV